MAKSSDERKRDEALKRALNMPPMPHKPSVNQSGKGKKKGDQTAGESKSGRPAKKSKTT
jgi:hypothetical protein